MKRVLGILMVCALLVTGLTTFVSASAASIAITTEEGPFVIGDTVTATVKLNNYTADSWSAMTITVNYDPTILAFDDVESGFGEDIGMVAEDKGDKVLICWIAQKLPVPQDSVLAKVNFTAIAETTEAIKITSSFVPAGIANQGSTDPVDNSNGDVFNPGVAETPEVEVNPFVPVDNTKITESTGSREGDVTATYVLGEKVEKYLIDIEWGALAFTYTDAKTAWDGEAYEWVPVVGEGAVDPVWTVDNEDGDKITVTNHSSQPVDVTITSDATEKTPKVTVENGEFTLAVAPAGPDGIYETATVKVEGALPSTHVAGDPIATITVTID